MPADTRWPNRNAPSVDHVAEGERGAVGRFASSKIGLRIAVFNGKRWHHAASREGLEGQCAGGGDSEGREQQLSTSTGFHGCDTFDEASRPTANCLRLVQCAGRSRHTAQNILRIER